MSKNSQMVYLPRSTIDYVVIRATYKVSEDRGVSYGKATELMMLIPGLLDETLEALASESPWFENDVKLFRDRVNI